MPKATPSPPPPEWHKPALPHGVFTMGRIFDAGELPPAFAYRGPTHAMRNYPGYALVLITGDVTHASYEDRHGFSAHLETGDVIFVHPRRTHRYGAEHATPWCESYLSFDGPIFDALETAGVLSASAPPVFQVGDRGADLRRCLADDDGHPLPMSIAVMRLAALLTEFAALRDDSLRIESGKETWIAEARQLLMSYRATVADVTAELSKTTGMTPDALRKQFRRKSGISMDQYRRDARLTNAMQLLENSSIPLKEISYLLDFTNEQHFSRTITAATGFTPGAIRSRRHYTADQKAETLKR